MGKHHWCHATLLLADWWYNHVRCMCVCDATGVTNTADDADATVTITLAYSSSDAAYTGVSSTTVATTIIDNDPVAVSCSPDCTALRRGTCTVTDTCAACTTGFTGTAGNSNNQCLGSGTSSSATGLTTIAEDGGTGTFGFALTGAPTSDVTVAVSSDTTARGTVSPASLTFTSGNWNVAQTVTVTGALVWVVWVCVCRGVGVCVCVRVWVCGCVWV